MKAKANMLLWLSDARGVFIPRDFAQSFMDRSKNVSGVSDDEWAILDAGPDQHPYYWETWDKVLSSAVVTDDDEGVKYTLHQDGNLWLVPLGMEWSEKDETFHWPENGDNNK